MTVGLRPVDIAWVAGIYESEGSCRPGLTDRNGIAATVTQKEPWLTERLCEMFGGHVGKARSRIRGKECFATVWRVHGHRARGLLMTIYAFLSPRRKRQVKVALLRTAKRNPESPPVFAAYADVLVEESRYLLRLARGVTPVQVAWAAGLFEGDGSCSPNATNQTRIGARVIQKDRQGKDQIRPR